MEHFQNKVKAIASALAKIDGSTMEEKARELGISRTTLWRWAKKASVRKELERYVDAKSHLLGLNLYRKVIAQAMSGDIAKGKAFQATKLFLELAGLGGSLEERISHLIEAGITPAVYAKLYHQITATP